jgi:hypothetical protein
MVVILFFERGTERGCRNNILGLRHEANHISPNIQKEWASIGASRDGHPFLTLATPTELLIAHKPHA